MGKLGLLGAMGGAGQAISETGKTMFADHLETLRQDRLQEAQGKRDEKLFGQKKEMADIDLAQKKEMSGIEQEQKKELKSSEYEHKSSEVEIDRQKRLEVATIRPAARKKVAAE